MTHITVKEMYAVARASDSSLPLGGQHRRVDVRVDSQDAIHVGFGQGTRLREWRQVVKRIFVFVARRNLALTRSYVPSGSVYVISLRPGSSCSLSFAVWRVLIWTLCLWIPTATLLSLAFPGVIAHHALLRALRGECFQSRTLPLNR